MFVATKKALPFPRGQTLSDGVLTPDDTWYNEAEGKTYWTEDTQHGTGAMIGLRVVKNDTAAAITAARRFGEFSIAGALDWGRRMGTFPCDTDGAVALPLDDAYTVGQTIPDNDLFYVIVYGFCTVETQAVSNFVAGMAVAASSLGVIRNLAQPTAGSFVIGTLDYAASYTPNSTATVWVDPPGLALPPAAG